MTPSSAEIRFEGLSRRFDDVVAVRDVSATVHAGEVVALLGRNGAGKSTTVRIAVGLDEPSAGSVTINGQDPKVATRTNVLGYCSQELAVYPSRSARDNLVYVARLCGLTTHEARDAAERVASLLGFSEYLDRQAHKLSGGFKRRLHLGLALVSDAPILVLDEPTAGVDIESRELVGEVVRGLADEGRAVLYTSHDLAEVERICDRIIVLHHGSVRAQGTVEELVTEVGELARFEFVSPEARDRVRAMFPGGTSRLRGAVGLDIQLADGASAADLVLRSRNEAWDIRRVEVVAPGLESVFLRLTATSEPASNEAEVSGDAA